MRTSGNASKWLFCRTKYCEIVYRDYKSSFKELLQKDQSITIHQRNLEYLAIEIYKVRMGISPKIMNEIFRFIKNSVYSLRSGIQLEKPSINTAQFGSESAVYLGAKTWELIPENIKSSKSVKLEDLPMPTKQNIRQSGWFCKLITSYWSQLLPYCF